MAKTILLTGVADTKVVSIDGVAVPLGESQQRRNHSQEFSWGYNGSGPAQLALGILMQLMPGALAEVIYQRFKFDIVAQLPQGADFEQEIDMDIYIPHINAGFTYYDKAEQACTVTPLKNANSGLWKVTKEPIDDGKEESFNWGEQQIFDDIFKFDRSFADALWPELKEKTS